ncbi:hypothetical protein ABT144_36655 [Streptomyces sp. NPDC002039]|uniref:hypothetical protein n=1 Tax=Streptomyces sp. NPDC002039 TaxID=3154660 RepID=UPI003329AF27
MHSFALPASLTVVVCLLYGAVGVRWWHRAAAGRALADAVAGLDVDPYHSAVVTGHATEAAAAELLLDRYAYLDHRGLVRLTKAGRTKGRTPAHPVPAALLEAVRRSHPRPVSPGRIHRHDAVYLERLAAYRRDREATWPRLPRPPGGAPGADRPCLSACGCLLLLPLLALMAASAMAVLESRPHTVAQWASTLATAAALVALWCAEPVHRRMLAATAVPDLPAERHRALPHPALTALDARRTALVHRGLEDRDRPRGPVARGPRVRAHRRRGAGGRYGTGAPGRRADRRRPPVRHPAAPRPARPARPRVRRPRPRRESP